ncbi:hypothetical protein CASFOL_039202 [Castilleja foliolosa]|uniref:Patellin-4 n=1 Tax=Castilleja foliolosa TaxID=1961234 RepID=A0ABD3BHB5_9LAMI
MAVEVKAEVAPATEQPVTAEVKCEKDESKPKIIEKSSSYREESNFLSDLKDHEKKALIELKTKLEDAILGNTLFVKDEKKEAEPKKQSDPNSECAETLETDDKQPETETVDIDQDISIWGVPLLPSKGNEKTDVVLLKFLRAREFKTNDAFEMLRKTLLWRKEFKIDSILDEEFDAELGLGMVAYMSGADRLGHPICYNIFGALENEFGSKEKNEQYLRWRVQLMEKGVQKLDFKADGVNSLVQIYDLGNLPGQSKKEVRAAADKAVTLLQDNYPEFVAKNIFINVPFWYFAYHSLLSPFLTQRTRSKLVFARPSKVTETLLKYIPIQEIPIQYGGIKIEDFEFSVGDDEPKEIVIKAGSTETIEIPTPECGTTYIWDLIVLGWEVKYTEEFVPTDENSYTMIIQKGKKMSSDENSIRNTFKNHEAGKIVLTIENCSGKKKKLFYRYKVKKTC